MGPAQRVSTTHINADEVPNRAHIPTFIAQHRITQPTSTRVCFLLSDRCAATFVAALVARMIAKAQTYQYYAELTTSRGTG